MEPNRELGPDQPNSPHSKPKLALHMGMDDLTQLHVPQICRLVFHYPSTR